MRSISRHGSYWKPCSRGAGSSASPSVDDILRSSRAKLHRRRIKHEIAHCIRSRRGDGCLGVCYTGGSPFSQLIKLIDRIAQNGRETQDLLLGIAGKARIGQDSHSGVVGLMSGV